MTHAHGTVKRYKSFAATAIHFSLGRRRHTATPVLPKTSLSKRDVSISVFISGPSSSDPKQRCGANFRSQAASANAFIVVVVNDGI